MEYNPQKPYSIWAKHRPKTYKPVTGLARVLAGPCKHSVKVTRIPGHGWGIRVFLNGVINQEGVVKAKHFIGIGIKQMLRMEDKCGNLSGMAERSRFRPLLSYRQQYTKQPPS